MSIDVRVDRAKKIRYIVITGSVTLSDIKATLNSVIETAKSLPDMYNIWDLRKADPDGIDRKFVEDLVAMRKKLPEREGAPIAILAESDVFYGMSRMFEILGEHLPPDIKVVRTLEDAETWVTKKI